MCCWENKIDLVYLWCNGNDENFIKERNYWASKEHYVLQQATNSCRFVDNNELKYSLRSVEMFAPWINRIFIVTNGQVPVWLDENHPKIKIIKHSDIMPTECLPTFNSCAIETYITNIPDLSEYFLYANDDMFFASPVKPEDFFSKKGYPIVRLCETAWSMEDIENKVFANTVTFSQNLCGEKFGKYYRYEPCHNIDAYRKSFCLECINSFKNEFDSVGSKRFREKNTIQRSIFSFFMLANNKGILKLCDAWHGGKGDCRACNITNLSSIKKIPKEVKLICLNDTEKANNTDRRNAKKIMMSMFNKSQPWEKVNKYQIYPVFDNKEAIVFAPDNMFCKYFSVALQSLIDNSSSDKNYDIVVFEQDISDKHKFKIFNMLPKNFNLRFFDVSEIIYDKFSDLDFKPRLGWSIAMFYRIFIPLVMQQYKKVLYLDSDICVHQSIDDIFNIDDGGKEVLAIRDSWGLMQNGVDVNTIIGRIEYMHVELGIENIQNYFNSGVIMFNISNINLDEYISKFKYASLIKELLYPDQDILNVIFKDKVKYLSWKWNFQYCELEYNSHFKEIILPEYAEDVLEAFKYPCIIHYTSPRKPWNTPDAWLSEIFWMYARKTPFYEEIIYNNCKSSIKECIFNIKEKMPQSNTNSFVKRVNKANRYSLFECFLSKKTKTKWNGNKVTHYRFLGISLLKTVQIAGYRKKTYLLGIRII